METSFFKRYWKLFFAGFAISFLGALPIGSLNLTASQIYGSGGLSKTIIFISTILLIEIMVVLGLLKASAMLRAGKKYLPYAMPIAVLLLVYLSYSCLFTGGITTNHMDGPIGSTLSLPLTSPFTLGVVLGISNPLQFPFWGGWNQWLYQRKILRKGNAWTMVYLFGIALGTLIGMAIFVYLAHRLQTYMKSYDFMFTWLLGLFYLGLAIYMAQLCYKLYLKPLYKAHV